MLVEGFPVIFDDAHLVKASTFQEDNTLDRVWCVRCIVEHFDWLY